jgi:hypothetical protein
MDESNAKLCTKCSKGLESAFAHGEAIAVDLHNLSSMTCPLCASVEFPCSLFPDLWNNPTCELVLDTTQQGPILSIDVWTASRMAIYESKLRLWPMKGELEHTSCLL